MSGRIFKSYQAAMAENNFTLMFNFQNEGDTEKLLWGRQENVIKRRLMHWRNVLRASFTSPAFHFTIQLNETFIILISFKIETI